MSVVPTESLSLLNPFNNERLTACSYYQLPRFHWETIGTYKGYEVQFSGNEDFESPLKVRGTGTSTELVMKSMNWKKVMVTTRDGRGKGLLEGDRDEAGQDDGAKQCSMDRHPPFGGSGGSGVIDDEPGPGAGVKLGEQLQHEVQGVVWE